MPVLDDVVKWSNSVPDWQADEVVSMLVEGSMATPVQHIKRPFLS
jgi:hypothetical protein